MPVKMVSSYKQEVLSIKLVSYIWLYQFYQFLGNTQYTNSSYYDLLKANNFNNCKKIQKHQQNQEQEIFNPAYLNNNSQLWNDSQQQQQQQKFPKKITKSSTTFFYPEMNQQKSSHFFPHSTSYDNLGALNKMKQQQPLKPINNDLFGQSSGDYLLENSFNQPGDIFVH